MPDRPIDDLEVARVTWSSFERMWWFSSRSDDPAAAGRFDLERPRGTCYFATDPVGALVEKLTDPEDLDAVVSATDLRTLHVWTGVLRHPESVADTTARRSRIPKELGTTTPYEPCWAWADALDADGRGGLMWWLRLDPGPGKGMGVFGPVSEDDGPPDPRVWEDFSDPEPASRWREELAELFDVVDPPSRAHLEVADHPDVDFTQV